jgi:hypothetical protein
MRELQFFIKQYNERKWRNIWKDIVLGFYSLKFVSKIVSIFLHLSFPWVFKAYPVTSLMKQPLLRRVLQVSSIAAQGVAVVCMQRSRVGSEIMTCTNLAMHHRLKIIWMELLVCCFFVPTISMNFFRLLWSFKLNYWKYFMWV